MAKRANNEGSVYQRADGQWCGAVTVAGKRKVFYAKTRGEVSKKLVQALATVQKGLPLIPERETVKTYLERWLIDVAKPSVRPSTYESYEGLVRVHLVPALGSVRLHQLGPADVQRVLNEKRAAGLSPRRVAYIRACLRIALNQALRWGIVARNVAALSNPPKAEPYVIKPWTPEQARAFLNFVKDDRLHALHAVALATGARQGELLALTWPDVDFDAGAVHITGTLHRVDGVLQICPTKTTRSRRSVTLPPTIVDALHAHRARQLRERLAVGPEWADTAFVFTTAFGAPLDTSSVTHRFQKLTARAELPRQRFHDLRHCCASFLLAEGVPARVVMEILGHSSIGLTLGTYSHATESLQREATDKLGALLAHR